MSSHRDAAPFKKDSHRKLVDKILDHCSKGRMKRHKVGLNMELRDGRW
jgi:hypothetical protein